VLCYETGTGTYITGRGMGWNDPAAKSALWTFPQGMGRDGGADSEGSITWVSDHGSVIVSFDDLATSDGMNEAGWSVTCSTLLSQSSATPLRP
jgi:choloylglycine hydrolase